MELAIHGSKDKLKVADAAFDRPFSQALVHQVVTAHLAGARSGTKANKNRSAVSGGGAKPWRQKGTGRARAGTIRSPLWRGGGVTFAASPKDHSQKVNKKMYRGAMAAIVSELIRTDRLVVVDDFVMDSHRTKDLVNRLREDHDADRALIVVDEVEEKLYLSSRNLRGVHVVDSNGIDPVTLVSAQKVIVTKAAMKKIEERLT